MKGLVRCTFIVLLVLVTIFTLTSGKRHKLSEKRRLHNVPSRRKYIHHYEQKLEDSYLRYRRKKYPGSHNYKEAYHRYPVHPEFESMDNRIDFYSQSKKDYFTKKHYRLSPHQKGRGIFSSLFSAPINVFKDLTSLNPLNALKGIVKGVSGTADKVASEFEDVANGIQTEARNFAADGINDLTHAADQPIYYQLFTPSNKLVPIIMIKTSRVDGSSWNKGQLTKVIIHGFSPEFKPTNTTLQLFGQLTIKDSYFAAGALYNIIVVDWTSLAMTYNYFSAAAATRIVGADLATFLYNLLQHGHLRSVEDVHIIGFSLGAHVSGIAGRLVQERINNGVKIGRITGLDPAELSFGQINGKMSKDARFILDKTDAKFVDVIHCNAGMAVPIHLGTRAQSGHADFYPNGGSDQPGCGGSIRKIFWHCSHSRCWQFFSESIASNKYVACNCESWEDFQTEQCECDNQEKIYMGENCNKRARGKFYLKANIDQSYAANPDQ